MFSVFKSPSKQLLKDAEAILNEVDYRIIRGAWDEYVHIQQRRHEDYGKAHRVATPAWYALQAIRNHNGDLKQFNKDDIAFLKALLDAYNAYDEIIETLKKYGKDEEEVKHLFQTHPKLYELLSADTVDKAIDLIIHTVENYRLRVHTFAEKHRSIIEKAIRQAE